MGDADERPQQIERVEIFTDIAALDRALHQRVDGSLNLAVGTFVELRGPPTSVFSAGAMICLAAM